MVELIILKKPGIDLLLVGFVRVLCLSVLQMSAHIFKAELSLMKSSTQLKDLYSGLCFIQSFR